MSVIGSFAKIGSNMKLHRFIGDWSLGEDTELKIFDAAILSQIKNVLRLNQGDKIILSDGGGQEAIALIADLNSKYLKVTIEEYRLAKTEYHFETILYCAVLKKENFELVVQKSTELGVKKIIPLITERTVKLGLNFDRLKKIAREASEQSGRGVVPSLSSPITLSVALENLPSETIALVLDETGQNFSHKLFGSTKNRAFFVGPEGGWSEIELKLIRQKGINLVKISNFTLRAETAAIIASFLLSYE